MRIVRATPIRSWSRPASSASRAKRGAAASRRCPPCSRTIRWGAWSSRRRSPPRWYISARQRQRLSPARPWSCPAERYEGGVEKRMDQSSTIPLDAETKVSERPDDHKTELRLWLRLLTCTTLIENEVRRRLRDNFDITLPRFDLLAQLERAPDGMTLGELSQRMMVSNGNITGLVDRLCEQGLISRRPSPSDRRVQIVSL